MSMVGYFKVDGSDGSITEKGFEKYTYCYDFRIDAAYEVDTVHHRVTGEPKIQPFIFFCKVEETAPEWLKLFRQGKECAAFFKLPVRTKGGTIVPYIQFEFKNCQITGWDLTQGSADPKETTPVHMCKLQLVCRKLTMTHDKYDEAGSITHRKTQDTYDFDQPTA